MIYYKYKVIQRDVTLNHTHQGFFGSLFDPFRFYWLLNSVFLGVFVSYFGWVPLVERVLSTIFSNPRLYGGILDSWALDFFSYLACSSWLTDFASATDVNISCFKSSNASIWTCNSGSALVESIP